ncbi:TlpA family protein disulfide reductase [Paraflavitalea soli]|uniref:TlpA family protein disulfide reductase n=1 Tax=Paraflavitalea soli TaxID=2315862 RepID=A0A3B7MUT9_9BACT|nr:TlpA disulfide reductase family protein [Paraflavitalea soli]AXY77153.1 TlpA family protein disulfide reductase [Paraflavitalea soli]
MKNPILFLLAITAAPLLQGYARPFAGDSPPANSFRANPVFTTFSDSTSDRFFDKLMKPYKGKVVYIDFWAPWCGPCIGEMPHSKALQKELAGKEVVFLYIGIGCSKQSWQSTIREVGIEGEHYYANENDGQLLGQKFNITGIPRYILVGKDGKVADMEALRPSHRAKLVKKINGMLK